MSEENLWYYMVGDDQLGPVQPEDLQQLAASGTITPESQLWTAGLEEWIQAAQVEGLFAAPAPAPAPRHPRLILGAEAQAAHPLAGEILPARVATAVPQVAVASSLQVAGTVTPRVATTTAPQAPLGHPGEFSPPGADYPAPGPMNASFGWFVTLPILAVLIMVGGFAVIIARVKSRANQEGMLDGADLLQSLLEAGGMLFLTTLLFGLCFLLFTILKMIVLHRAWRALQFGHPRTTPGKAVGLLFIPFFHFYWRFVAYLGLAKDWNRIHATHPNLVGAPSISEGLVTAYCITSLLFKLVWWGLFFANLGNDDPANNPLGLPMAIVWLIALLLEIAFLSGVCRLVNFMGRLHLRHTHPAGGLRLY